MREYALDMPPGNTREPWLYRCQCLTATGKRCKRPAAEYRQTSGGDVVAACWQHIKASYPKPYYRADE
ncbi:MAG: hypothetical protein FKY71_20420 [Spiribacter salinus]|uniref:Uncharacterized protein n=1 Tax=Spiribacter salinus TaxID=1335746 RepID=A0A540V1G9_9GAMM|nr:MAG: hypothetical protein FKY71_20420 [Spiribacter salinus]